jgi:hypothetical protein
MINCGDITKEELNKVLDLFNSSVLEKYKEIEEIRNNGTISKYNLIYNFKKFVLKLNRNIIERKIYKLKEPENYPYKFNQSKLVEDINIRIEDFLKKYQEILDSKDKTNILYIKTINIIKIAAIIFICFILLIILLSIAFMIYITSPSCRKYNLLIDSKENDKIIDHDKNSNIIMNTNDSASFKVVKVLNNFIKSEKKRK